MKQPKKLTLEHKKFLSKCNIDPRYWMLQYEDNDRYIYINTINSSTRERIKWHDAN